MISSIDPSEQDRHKPPKPILSNVSVRTDIVREARENFGLDERVRSKVCAFPRVVEFWLCSKVSSSKDLIAPHLFVALAPCFRKYASGSNLQVHNHTRPGSGQLIEPAETS